MNTLADAKFQENVVAEIARLAGIDLNPVEDLDKTLQEDNKPNSPGAMVLPEIPITASEEEKLTVAQTTLRSMASIKQYIQEHPQQEEAV
ncbi:hypothetical protein, partial [Pseudomonas syringae]|uniref:hypothetical protein n=1 Tax=Pseudomonas syringae TaxID=317 RepID=UPI000AB78852